MKHFVLACLVLVLAFPAVRGSPTDAAIVAAMKLTEAPNYSWVTSVDDDARSYDITGQTNLAGPGDFSLVDLPMVAAVRRRVPSRGSANSDNQVTAIYTGDEKYVIQTPDGWKKPDELSQTSRGESTNQRGGSAGGGFGGKRGRRGAGGGERGPVPPYSNLQTSLSRPHEEIGIIIAGYTDIKTEGDVVSGTLSEISARLLLVHAGQSEVTPLRASGTFRLWITNGVLTKYELKLEGRLAVITRGDRREVDVHETATTQLKDVGKTKFEVPDEARKKLGG
ncbi:MAG: hypothetical protein EXS32_09700 [Opitutus sp.]|nr:hypothetical protein [Opitutus sp.]